MNKMFNLIKRYINKLFNYENTEFERLKNFLQQ